MAEFCEIVLHEEGGKVVPRLESLDEARLPPGEVTVAVEYSALNYKDGMILQGQGRLVRQYPHVPGIDFAGTVEQSWSPDFAPGDPVLLTGWRVGELHWGGYAEKARVKAEHLVRRPEGLSAPHATGDDPDTAQIPRQRGRLRIGQRQRPARDGDPVPAARGQPARHRLGDVPARGTARRLAAPGPRSAARPSQPDDRNRAAVAP